MANFMFVGIVVLLDVFLALDKQDFCCIIIGSSLSLLWLQASALEVLTNHSTKSGSVAKWYTLFMVPISNAYVFYLHSLHCTVLSFCKIRDVFDARSRKWFTTPLLLSTLIFTSIVIIIFAIFCLLAAASMKKCRARYGLDQQDSWCRPCR